MTNSEHMNEDGKCYCGSLVCVGNLTVMLEKLSLDNANLTNQIIAHKERAGAYEDSIERLNAERQRDLERLQNTIRKTDDFRDNLAKVADLIKPLLEDETIEPTSSVGEELIELLGIEMTKEISIEVVLTYRVSATIPSHYDAQEWVDEQVWEGELDESYALLDSVDEIESTATVID